ncbi:DUF547 domain-containing protein [Haladaptatus caseinilyticus]|uniref:DUF547 domain-containing protein n=1 Tax=Haladaptatus caseinilyticus TaxID=2993314 RepID=UPI00224A895B|nr:DUF547 domain-containing protein [Haladaptatus caseinilyticus]
MAVRHGENPHEYVRHLARLNDNQLSILQDSHHAALTFWLNLYNATVQYHLESDPGLFDTKRRFFRKPRIDVAGTALSLDAIEHGLLRHSKWKYGLGYIPSLFPSQFERRHRLQYLDPRIHFALNCGAESCPPIVAYSLANIDAELDVSARSFLSQSTTYDTTADVIHVSRLFLYYRGDFGGRSGIYDCLRQYDVLQRSEHPRIKYKPYDWALHKGMYRDIPE